MRVLQVIPSVAHRTGGPAVMAVQLARALGSCGVENAIYSTDMALPAQAASAQRVTADDLVPCSSEVELRLFPAWPPHRFVYSPQLRRALRRDVGGYDVVHFHSIFLYPGVAAYSEASRAGVPHVISLHGSLDPWQRARRRPRKVLADRLWVRRMLESAAAIHVDTDDEARLASDVVPHVPRTVVAPGVDWEELQRLPSPTHFRERFLGGADGPLVLSVARIAENKGHDVLIRAFASVVREVPEARLALIGPDDQGLQPQLVELAAAEGVREQVVFVGMASEEEKRSALAAASVWALPSLAEAFGIAAVEALAAGVPVVVSPNVNLAPELEASGAGVVAERTAEAFAAEILALLRDEARRRELTERGREFARRYDWRALAPQWVEAYERAAA